MIPIIYYKGGLAQGAINQVAPRAPICIYDPGI